MQLRACLASYVNILSIWILLSNLSSQTYRILRQLCQRLRSTTISPDIFQNFHIERKLSDIALRLSKIREKLRVCCIAFIRPGNPVLFASLTQFSRCSEKKSANSSDVLSAIRLTPLSVFAEHLWAEQLFVHVLSLSWRWPYDDDMTATVLLLSFSSFFNPQLMAYLATSLSCSSPFFHRLNAAHRYHHRIRLEQLTVIHSRRVDVLTASTAV